MTIDGTQIRPTDLINTGRFHQLACDKGFWGHIITGFQCKCGTCKQPDIEAVLTIAPEKIALIHSELSEALEAIRVPDAEQRLFYYSVDKAENPKPEGVISELADAVIRCYDLATALGVDLTTVIDYKHKYNKTRPRMHGKRF